MKKTVLLYLLTFGFCSSASPLTELEKGEFISVQGEVMPYSAFLGAGLGYGRNVMFQTNYLGFVAINLKLNYMFDNKHSFNEEVKIIYFTELDYGYEFMRHNMFSFGLITSHGIGLTYKGKPALSNGIGVFGKFQKESYACSLEFGVKHLNPFNSMAYERIDYYLRLNLQYRL